MLRLIVAFGQHRQPVHVVLVQLMRVIVGDNTDSGIAKGVVTLFAVSLWLQLRTGRASTRMTQAALGG